MIVATTPNIDETAALLADRISFATPTAYFRFGDGLLELLNRMPGKTVTCDGEHYSDDLRLAMKTAVSQVLASPEVLLGNWARDPKSTAYLDHWLALTEHAECQLVDFEALLIVRKSQELVDFYRAVRDDDRRKIFMGPWWNAPAAVMLNAFFMQVPHQNLFHHIGIVESQLRAQEFDILLFGAGMAGNIPVINLWRDFPDRTYINLGSAMDPLFKGRTRSNQLEPEAARALFAEIL